MAPVLSSPAPMIITAMIDTTALLESPLIASFGVTRPRIGRIINEDADDINPYPLKYKQQNCQYQNSHYENY